MKAAVLGVLFGLLAAFLIGRAHAAETGPASFYGGPRHHGHLMANGQRFDQNSDSCAHRHHPFGTVLRVIRAGHGSVSCTVRDRGPFIRGRILDLSVAGARALGMIVIGVARVSVEKMR